MNTIIMALGTLLVTVLVALFAVPPLIDWNTYRGIFEVEVSRLIGREVRVGGDVNLRLLPQPYIRFEKLVIADAPGITGEPFVRAESFTLRLAVPPLLSGIIEARDVEVDQATVQLRIGEDGIGNWQKLAVRPAAYGMRPVAVSLQRMTLTNSQFAIDGPGGRAIARIGDIDGEISAASVNGPFKFNGRARLAGEIRDVRVSTGTWSPGTPAADLKLVVRTDNSEASVALDGQLAWSSEQPVGFDGAVTVILPPVAASPDAVPPGSAQAPSGGANDAPSVSGEAASGPSPIEIKGNLKADPRVFRIDDLIASFDQAGRPQLLAGSLRGDLVGDDGFELDLSSHWLDLDRISGLGSSSSIIGVAQRIVSKLSAAASGYTAKTLLRLAIDQATVAGDELGRVSLEVAMAPDKIRIDRFSALAPGRTAIRLDGTLPITDGKLGSFQGHALAEGENASRFAGWLGRGAASGMAVSPQSFAISSAITIAPDIIRLENGRLRIGGSRIDGGLTYGLAPDGEIEVSLAGSEIDLAPVLADTLDSDRIRQLLGLGQRDSAAVTGARPLRIHVEAGRLKDAKRSYSNVAIDLRSTSAVLDITRFKATTQSGLAVELAGSLKRGDPGPLGVISGTIRSATASGARELSEILRTVGDVPVKLVQRDLPAPFDLAYRVAFRDQGEARFEVSLDGRVRGDDVRMSLRSAGTLDNLVDQPLDFTADIEADRPADVVAWLRGETLAAGRSVSQPGGANSPSAGDFRLVVEAAGTPSKGMTSFAALTGSSERIAFRGVATLDGDHALGYDGQLEHAVADGATLARMIGLVRPETLRRVAMSGTGRIQGTTRRILFDVEDQRIGEMKAQGRIEITHASKDGRSAIKGDMAFDRIDLVSAIDYLLDSEPQNGQPSDAPSPAADPIALRLWSGRHFTVSALSNLDIALRVAAERIDVAGQQLLTAGSFDLKGEGSSLAVENLVAEAPLGGRLEGRLVLNSETAGRRLEGRLAIAGLDLARFVPATQNAGQLGTGLHKGRAGIEMEFTGAGLSPRAIAGLLRGKGEVRLEGAVIHGVPPEAITRAAASFVSGEVPTAELVEAALRRELLAGSLPVGDRTLALTIRDGAIDVATLKAGSNMVTAENATTISIDELAVDSRWRLRAPASSGGQLPAIDLLYAGRLLEIASRAPRIAADALVRELQVQRMEGNVAELERLRQQDEERARREDALRRQRELENQQAQERARQREIVPGFGAPPVIRVPLPPPPGEAGQRSGIEPESLGTDGRVEQAAALRPGVMRLGALVASEGPTTKKRSSVAMNAKRPVPVRKSVRRKATDWRSQALFSNR